MDRNKIILLIVLVLIVAAYIFFVVWGATSDDNKGSGGGGGQPKKTPVTADNYSPYPVTKNAGKFMGDWLGRFLPKPEIPCAVPAAKDDELVCDSVSIGSGIKIPAKKGSSFRIATLVLKQGKARVEYDDDTDASSDADLDEQDFDLPDTEHDNARESTIIIFESGGNLRVTCRENTNCKVGFK